MGTYLVGLKHGVVEPDPSGQRQRETFTQPLYGVRQEGHMKQGPAQVCMPGRKAALVSVPYPLLFHWPPSPHAGQVGLSPVTSLLTVHTIALCHT